MRLRPVPVGDIAEKWLRRFGITPAMFGESCGCEARKSALNAWGYKFQYKMIMHFGGPGEMKWRARLRFLAKRLWKITASRLTARNGSGGTRR